MSKEKSLNKNLKDLDEIVSWFNSQEDLDVEERLNKIKEAIKIIKDSKERLKEVENEFEEIKKEINLEEENDY